MVDSDGSWAAGFVGHLVNNRYRLDRVLGTGGMGAVFSATNVAVGRVVALKVLSPALSTSATTVERFQQEARAAASVGGRGVVAVFDFDRDARLGPFLVMEQLAGESLEDQLERRVRVPPAEAATVAVTLLNTLAAVHARNIVHRDLKPSNVFFAQESDGTSAIKILDFGIARMVGEGQQGAALTRPGTILGTPQFMAPEQARAVPDIDLRADLYAVGAIMYRSLSGVPPYNAGDLVAVLSAMMSGPPAPLRAVSAGLPEALYAFVDRAMAYDRAQRFPDATAMANALRALWPALQGLEAAAMPTNMGYAQGAAALTPGGATPSPFAVPTGVPYGAPTPYAPASTAALHTPAPGLPATHVAMPSGYPAPNPFAPPQPTHTAPGASPPSASSSWVRPIAIAVGAASVLVAAAAGVAWWATSKSSNRRTAAHYTPRGTTTASGPTTPPAHATPASDLALDAALRAQLEEGRAAAAAGDLPRARNVFNNAITQALSSGAPSGSISARLSAEAAIALGDLELARMVDPPQPQTVNDLSPQITAAYDPWRATIAAYPRATSSGHGDMTQCSHARMGRSYERMREVMLAFQAPVEDPYGAGANVVASQHNSTSTYIDGARRYYEMALAPDLPMNTPCRTDAQQGLARVNAAGAAM